MESGTTWERPLGFQPPSSHSCTPTVPSLNLAVTPLLASFPVLKCKGKSPPTNPPDLPLCLHFHLLVFLLPSLVRCLHIYSDMHISLALLTNGAQPCPEHHSHQPLGPLALSPQGYHFPPNHYRGMFGWIWSVCHVFRSTHL